MPDGGFMPGGGAGGGGVIVRGTEMASGTPGGGQQPRGRGMGGIPAPVLNALIQYLQETAES